MISIHHIIFDKPNLLRNKLSEYVNVIIIDEIEHNVWFPVWFKVRLHADVFTDYIGDQFKGDFY